ncbi:MAG: hypothetical protein H0V66_06610 [Bdellovibrionales bacterium]|nr:hypothetical protein [Bdellovibrionales bacterium]
MRRFSFLPTELVYGFLILWFYALWNWSFGYKVLTSVLVFAIFYAFRKISIPYRDTLKNNGEIFLSPIHGVVESIRRDTSVWDEVPVAHEVRISISGWAEKGLYLPTAGEVSYLKANRGKKIPRGADSQEFYRPMVELSHTDFILTSKNQTKSLMRFIDCTYGQRPTIWLKSGDRGRGAACFGFYPFGGTLIIYLPQNSDILVFEKERVVPGQTVIAAFKDVK